jgi:hypothetical protein
VPWWLRKIYTAANPSQRKNEQKILARPSYANFKPFLKRRISSLEDWYSSTEDERKMVT